MANGGVGAFHSHSYCLLRHVGSRSCFRRCNVCIYPDACEWSHYRRHQIDSWQVQQNPRNASGSRFFRYSLSRPRPDFLSRCWPDTYQSIMAGDSLPRHDDLSCTGDQNVIIEGRKSFPSGHSSFAFASFGFAFFYLSGKLKSFSDDGRVKHSFHIVTPLLLLLGNYSFGLNNLARDTGRVSDRNHGWILVSVPTCIAISRTCDYHHHWQDVAFGSALGLFLAWWTYRFYFPPLSSPFCDQHVVLAYRKHKKLAVDDVESQGLTQSA